MPRERVPTSIIRYSGMRHLAQARNPYSRSWLWIPGLRYAHPGMTEERTAPLPRQITPDHRQEEYRHIDQKSDRPQDRAQGRAVAEIGEDIGDPHDQEQHRQFVDQVLRAET